MTNKLFKTLTAFIISIISFFSVCLLFPVIPSFADGITENGKYKINFESSIDTQMGMGAFENKVKQAVVEKIGDNYYLTMSFDTNSITQIKLVSDDLVGFTSVMDGSIKRITYTMSKKNIVKEHKFSAYIPAMNKGKEFTVTPLLDTAQRIGDADESVERPPEFIPAISTMAADTEMEKGSDYLVAPATATLCGASVPVGISAYYVKSGERVSIDIVDNNIRLDNAGEYHVVYKAESDTYKTNKGNNTVNIIDVKIISKVGATSLAKIENIEGKNVLSDDAKVQAGKVDIESVEAEAIKEQMKKIADNYEIFSVAIYNKDGSQPEFTDKYALYLAVNSKYDRRNINVYHADSEGNLTKIDAEGYGRYVKVETDKTGNFVVCIPGVAIKIDSMGYTLLGVTIGFLVLALIVVPAGIIIYKKTMVKRALSASENNDNDNVTEDNISADTGENTGLNNEVKADKEDNKDR